MAWRGDIDDVSLQFSVYSFQFTVLLENILLETEN
jgi:hypothetical protein